MWWSSLWIKVRGEAATVALCCRPLIRMTKYMKPLNNWRKLLDYWLWFSYDFSLPNICWNSHKAGHKQLSTFLENVKDNCLITGRCWMGPPGLMCSWIFYSQIGKNWSGDVISKAVLVVVARSGSWGGWGRRVAQCRLWTLGEQVLSYSGS